MITMMMMMMMMMMMVMMRMMMRRMTIMMMMMMMMKKMTAMMVMLMMMICRHSTRVIQNAKAETFAIPLARRGGDTFSCRGVINTRSERADDTSIH